MQANRNSTIKETMACRLYALHGFLGRPDDWWDIFKEHTLNQYLEVLDLFADNVLPLDAWTTKIACQISDEKVSSQRVLMGYSLGGRLALHLALHRPQDWEAIVIISAHPGLSNEEDRMIRLAQDEEWAKRFQSEPWDSLMQEWNGRQVFQRDRFSFERKESDFKRDILAAALRSWSLGNQQDLSQSLSKLSCPVFWIAGEEDIVYALQAQKIQNGRYLRHPQSRVWLAPGCGHRVPWQNTERFILELTLFLHELKQRA